MPKRLYRVLLDGVPFDETSAVSAVQATNNVAFKRFPKYERREMRSRMDAIPLTLVSRFPKPRSRNVRLLFPDCCPACQGNKLVSGEICPECYGHGVLPAVPVTFVTEALPSD